MKVAFTTLGCRVNQYESEAMAEKFLKEGFEIVDYHDFSDIYVINTCTVTNMGDKKSRQMINRAKRNNPDAVVAVVGFYSQVAPDEVAAIEGVDVVLGTRNKGDIVYWVNRAMLDKKRVVEVQSVRENNVFEELNIEEYQDKTRAFLKIQDGCNRFCSYCLIPYARGPVCSKKESSVLEEVVKLASNGFREVILSGIHTASYGVDLEEKTDLVTLLEKIELIEGIERVRIGSIDPTFFTEGVMERIAALKKLCPHFHLSLQSGCDDTLKRMNRHYTASQYKEIVDRMRVMIPEVSITTDVIVGFPGETEEEFKCTYEFMSEIKLSKMHVFKYSPREGTRAAEMEKQVPAAVKEERSKKLLLLNLRLEKEFMERYAGKQLTVLFEQKYSNIEESYVGYTPNYIQVVVKSDENLEGQIRAVDLLEVKDDFILGGI